MKRTTQVLVMVVVLLSLSGCGSDSSDSIFTGTNPTNTNPINAPTTGSVTFNFVRTQTPLTVPSDTQEIRFDFFDGVNGTGSNVLSVTLPFAPSVTVNDVPTTAKSVVVTALGGGGTGLLAVVVPNISVLPDTLVIVDFEGLTPDPDPDPDPILCPRSNSANP